MEGKGWYPEVGRERERMRLCCSAAFERRRKCAKLQVKGGKKQSVSVSESLVVVERERERKG